MALAVWLFAAAPAAALVLEFQPTFETADQNMWESGDAVSLDFDQHLFDLGWGSRENPLPASASFLRDVEIPGVTIPNPLYVTYQTQLALHNNSCVTLFGVTKCAIPAPSGPVPPATITTPPIDLGTYGLESSATTAGQFGMDFRANVNGGTVAAKVPLTVSFEIDDAELAPGQTFTLKSDFVINSTAEVNTVSPTAEAGLYLESDLLLESESSACFGTCSEVQLIPDINIEETEIELLKIDPDGLSFLGIRKEDLLETAIGQLTQQDEKRTESELETLKQEEEEAAALEEQQNSEIADLDKDIDSANRQVKGLDRLVKQAEKDIKKIDKEVENSTKSIDQTNQRIAENDTRVAEIDSELSDPDSGLSDEEKNKLATEKSGLVAQNDRLQKRNAKLESRKTDLVENKKPQAEVSRDVGKSARDTKKAQIESLKDDKKTKTDARDETRKRRKTAKFKRRTKSLLAKIPKVGELIDVDLSVPVVETAGTLTYAPDGSGNAILSSGGEDQFLELKLGVDEVLDLAVKGGITAASAGLGSFVFLIPPLSKEATLTDLLQAEYAVFDLNVGPRLFATQDFEFTPEFEVILDIGSGDPIVFDLGDEVDILFPEGMSEFSLNPSFRVKNANNFTNTTGIKVLPIAELAVLGMVAGIDLSAAGLGTRSIELGPVVGDIDGIDLVPLEHTFDALEFGFDLYATEFALGGFGEQSGGNIVLTPGDTQLLTNGDMESLDGWTQYGKIELVERPDAAGNQAAQLETASPVSLVTIIDTPEGPFFLVYDYLFEADGGVLNVFLDSILVDTLEGLASAEFIGRSVFIDDPILLGLLGVELEFEFFDVAGKVMYLDNVGMSGLAATDVTPPPEVPEPPAFPLILMGLGALAVISRRRARG